ncbi:hypothetical protein [Streptodolium elevatio]|uniref:Integral membrane protein n=1 Tax=Streptodolium elevatio TaxID=3157996 RepID=A0ABV3DJC1_9ACTN
MTTSADAPTGAPSTTTTTSAYFGCKFEPGQLPRVLDQFRHFVGHGASVCLGTRRNGEEVTARSLRALRTELGRRLGDPDTLDNLTITLTTADTRLVVALDRLSGATVSVRCADASRRRGIRDNAADVLRAHQVREGIRQPLTTFQQVNVTVLAAFAAMIVSIAATVLSDGLLPAPVSLGASCLCAAAGGPAAWLSVRRHNVRAETRIVLGGGSRQPTTDPAGRLRIPATVMSFATLALNLSGAVVRLISA